jgi:hypothetical protein
MHSASSQSKAISIATRWVLSYKLRIRTDGHMERGTWPVTDQSPTVGTHMYLESASLKLLCESLGHEARLVPLHIPVGTKVDEKTQRAMAL